MSLDSTADMSHPGVGAGLPLLFPGCRLYYENSRRNPRSAISSLLSRHTYFHLLMWPSQGHGISGESRNLRNLNPQGQQV